MTPNLRLRMLAAIAACAAAASLAHCSASGDSTDSTNFPSTNKKDGGSKDGSMSGSGSGSSSGAGDDDDATSDDASPGDDVTGDDGSIVGVDGGTCTANSTFPQPQSKFVDLAIPAGTALTKGQSDSIPADAGAIATPAGWEFHKGGLCRDGSPAGFFVHYGTADKLYIYLEGGGACDSSTFCSHNPGNLQTVFAGGAATQGQVITGSLSFASTGQVPYVASGGYSPGMFDTTNSANPFKDWSGVYVPYCTGDVHFGTKDDVDIPSDGVLPDLPHQHFVGRKNLESYIARIVPTFKNVSQVLLTGASAGGFGAGLNYGMVQDSFGKIPVVVIDDSGPPFSATYLPPCLQKKWRELWGFDDALPSDCAECKHDDGSGLTDVVYYWLHKYPKAKVGIVSTMHDEVIRLFFAQGVGSCASDNATSLTLAQAACGGYSCDMYTQGLTELRTTFECTGRLATYYIGGKKLPAMGLDDSSGYHQHIFRNDFYLACTDDGSITMAQWAQDFLDGKLENVGP